MTAEDVLAPIGKTNNQRQEKMTQEKPIFFPFCWS
jgi:hypothetical protein